MTDAEIRRLEELASHAWPADRVEALGGWRLQFDKGVTRRANSVLPTGWTGGVAMAEALREVEHRYHACQLRPCFKLTAAALPKGLDDRLAERGYQSQGHSLVLTAAAGAVHGPSPSQTDIELLDAPTAAWIEACWPGEDGDLDVAARLAIARRIGSPHVFALARFAGRAVGAALMVLESGWACITAVRTIGELRRQGIASTLIAALIGWARGRDAASIYLQVEADNRAARRLYSTFGFQEAYPYHYRILPGPGDGGVDRRQNTAARR